jgi:hypothetical protein
MWMQMMCHDMHKKLLDDPLNSWTGLGWSPFKGGMHQLAVKFGVHPNGWDLDGGSWEARLSEDTLMRIAKMKFRFLHPKLQTPENLTRLKNLYRMISTGPIVMPDGYVFEKGTNGWGGNLTGQVGTAHDNTIFMLAVFAYSFIRLIGRDFDLFLQ